MNVEEFLAFIKSEYLLEEIPNVITQDNVNVPLTTAGGFNSTFIEIAVLRIEDAWKNILPHLLSLGARVSGRDFSVARSCNRLYLTETYNLKEFSLETCVVYGVVKNELYLAMDYGISVPKTWSQICPTSSGVMDLESYASIISFRVASSRKALAALMILRKVKDDRGRATFGASRDVGVALAMEMWGARGPSGCGPRAHIWFSGWRKN